MAKKLRILANIQRYDYGIPERGNSFEYDTFFRLFRKLGHQVVLFDYGSNFKKGGTVAVDAGLTKLIKKHHFDLIFTFPSEQQVSYATLDKLKKSVSGAVSIAWMADDKWRWEKYSQFLAPHFDHMITTDPEAIRKYISIGYHSAILSQWAHDPVTFKKQNRPKKFDVVFVGGISAWRAFVVKYLRQQGVQVTCFGAGWPSQRLTISQMVNVYNQTRIVINISNSTQTYLPYLLDFQGWHWCGSWKESIAHTFPGLVDVCLSHKRREDIKARFFEVTGSGAFLLSYPVKHLDLYFKAGRDLVLYDTLPDLVAQTKYYLSQPKKRHRIADNGYHNSHQHHTYQQRLKQVFKQIGL